MKLTPENSGSVGVGLDHPEGLCVGPDGALFAGGEAGQVYRIDPDGTQAVIGSTDGFLLGVALDGQGRIHACDLAKKAVFRIEPGGTVVERSRGAPSRAFLQPNFPVFDQAGNLYVSDSGDFHHPHPGNGCIMKIAPDNTTTVFHAGPFMFANGLAIDPSGEWLYVVQSTASNVVRVSLAAPDREVRVAYRLPEDTVPDGLAFTTDDRLVISCYAPDIVYLGEPAGDGDGDGVGDVEVLVEDPSGALMNRPTNVALHDGRLYIASLGGWSITTVATDLVAAPLRRPDQPV